MRSKLKAFIGMALLAGGMPNTSHLSGALPSIGGKSSHRKVDKQSTKNRKVKSNRRKATKNSKRANRRK